MISKAHLAHVTCMLACFSVRDFVYIFFFIVVSLVVHLPRKTRLLNDLLCVTVKWDVALLTQSLDYCIIIIVSRECNTASRCLQRTS